MYQKTEFSNLDRLILTWMANVEDESSKATLGSYIETLPSEIWYEILLLCGIVDIANIIRTEIYRWICNVILSDCLWKDLFKRDFIKFYSGKLLSLKQILPVDMYPDDVRDFLEVDNSITVYEWTYDSDFMWIFNPLLRNGISWKQLYIEHYGVRNRIGTDEAILINKHNWIKKAEWCIGYENNFVDYVASETLNVVSGGYGFELHKSYCKWSRYDNIYKSVYKDDDKLIRYMSEYKKKLVGCYKYKYSHDVSEAKYYVSHGKFSKYGISISYYNNGDISIQKWETGLNEIISYTFSIECVDSRFAGKYLFGIKWNIKLCKISETRSMFLYWPVKGSNEAKLFRKYVKKGYIGWDPLAREHMIYLYSLGY